METKKQLVSTLISTQLLTQKQSLRKNQKLYKDIPSSSTTENTDGYLLTGSIKNKFIVMGKPFSSTKTVGMQDYVMPKKWKFDPSLFIPLVGSNGLSLEDTPEALFKRVIATVESLKKEHNEVVISNIIVARAGDLKEKC